MTRPPVQKSTVDARAVVLAGVLVTWFWAMAAGNLPSPALDRVRDLDRWGGLVPSWRLFAPVPVAHDRHLYYRLVGRGGGTGDWCEVAPPADRSWSHAVWFPDRRRDKALSDLTRELLSLTETPGAPVAGSPPYRVLRGMAEAAVRAAAPGRAGPRYQFAVASRAGHADRPARWWFVSPVLRAATGPDRIDAPEEMV